MKRVKVFGFMACSALYLVAGCKKEQTVTQSAPAVVQAVAPPSLSEYQPVGEGSAFFNLVTTELNYHSTGQQAALLEIVNNTFDSRAGRPAGYYFVLYNPKVENRAESDDKQECDLGKMFFDDTGKPFKQMSYYARGEGLMTRNAGLENEKYVEKFSFEGCRFALFGVRSDGKHIPEDGWSKGAEFASKETSAQKQ